MFSCKFAAYFQNTLETSKEHLWRALNKAASDNIVKIASRAEEAVTDNFYMDDYFDSFHTVQEAIKVLTDVANALNEEGFRLTKWVSNVTNALSEEGFRLTKWVSNDQQILQVLPSQEVSLTLINLDFDDISIERALEMLWNPDTNASQSNRSNRKGCSIN